LCRGFFLCSRQPAISPFGSADMARDARNAAQTGKDLQSRLAGANHKNPNLHR
jgi:hypothetical protein